MSELLDFIFGSKPKDFSSNDSAKVLRESAGTPINERFPALQKFREQKEPSLENVKEKGVAAKEWFLAQDKIDQAAIASMPIPVLGDILGLVADAKGFKEDPSLLTGLFSMAGLIPFVPRGGILKKGAEGLEKGEQKVTDITRARTTREAEAEVDAFIAGHRTPDLVGEPPMDLDTLISDALKRTDQILESRKKAPVTDIAGARGDRLVRQAEAGELDPIKQGSAKMDEATKEFNNQINIIRAEAGLPPISAEVTDINIASQRRMSDEVNAMFERSREAEIEQFGREVLDEEILQMNRLSEEARAAGINVTPEQEMKWLQEIVDANPDPTKPAA